MRFLPAVLFAAASLTAQTAVTPYGTGCHEEFVSVYQVSNYPGVNNAPFDLSRRTVTLTRLDGTYNSGFRVTTSAPLANPPTFPLPPIANALNFGSADYATVGNMHIGKRGMFRELYAPGNVFASIQPDIRTFLDSIGCFGAWSDFTPANSGVLNRVYYTRGSGNRHEILYAGVTWNGAGTPTWIKLTYDAGPISCTIQFGTVDTTRQWLVGYDGGSSLRLDPGNQSFLAGPIYTSDDDKLPLGLRSWANGVATLPVQPPLGAPRVFEVTTDNIHPSASLHFGLIGLTATATPLSSVALPSDCFLYNDVLFSVAHVLPGGASPYSFQWTAMTIPSIVAFRGLYPDFFVQSATFSSPYAWNFSNGLACEPW